LEIKVRRYDQEFFNQRNYLYLHDLITIIEQITQFTKDISKMKTLLKFKCDRTKSIEKTFKELCKDFDNCIINIDTLNFPNMIKSKIHPEEEIEVLRYDQEELIKVSFKVIFIRIILYIY